MMLSRLFRLIWGGDVDRELRPVLGVGFAGSVAGSTAWVFLGIWAKTRLGASDTQLGIAFLVAALLSMGLGFLGGHLSDRFGRRPLILLGEGGQTLAFLAFALVGRHVLIGLVLVSLVPALGSLGGAADQAMVADLVPPERHEAGYAATRVASNFGATFGPPIGGGLLLFDSWPAFFLGAGLLSSLAWLIAWRYIPRGGAYAPDEPPSRGSFAVIRRDRPFLLFLGSSILAWMTYVAYEILLPISLITTHKVPKALWGLLVIVNPVFVAVFQMRLIRWTAGISAPLKLAIAMPLMGVPFLLLNVTAAIPVVLFVIVVFVVGEMLWIPTSNAAVAAFAPADIRGAYMGFFGSSAAIAWALGPFLGLQVRHAGGDATMWVCVATLSVLAAAAGAAALHGRRAPGPEAVASGA